MLPVAEVPREVPPLSGRVFVLGISGASGAPYAVRLLEQMLLGGHVVHLVVSEYGQRLVFDELGVRRIDLAELCPHFFQAGAGGSGGGGSGGGGSGGGGETFGAAMRPRVILHPNKDVGAVIASGSFIHHGMVVMPCSSTSLGAIATGSGSNLLSRAAMVTLKERRPLIVGHREMPLSLIDIENMRQLTLAGAIMCSPNPGFYLLPTSVHEIVDFTVGKVLDLLGVPHGLKIRWEDAGR